FCWCRVLVCDGRVCRWIAAFSSCLLFRVTGTTGNSALSLHDALPILYRTVIAGDGRVLAHDNLVADAAFTYNVFAEPDGEKRPLDRKSTRLNSSHVKISYAVFCLKKKRKSILTFSDAVR